ncbi:unnamed protein product [Sympodiomycopsis kandeliae]
MSEDHPDTAGLPRILIVDHFDSYTLNLLSLLSSLAKSDQELAEKVVVLPHTHPLLSSQESFAQHVLPHLDAVILSPGPGSPHVTKDFGFGLEFLKNAHQYQIPTLGICLGHQGLAVAFGGTVKRAQSIQHGTTCKLQFKTDSIASQGRDLFQGIPNATAVTRYNSLTVDPDDLPECLHITATSKDPIVPRNDVNHIFSASSHDLIRSRATSPHVVASQQCIQGLVHKTLPLWGVQFHPESIESQKGLKMMNNFIEMVAQHHSQESSTSINVPSGSEHSIPLSIRQAGQRYVAASANGASDTRPAFRQSLCRVTESPLSSACRPSSLAGKEDLLFNRVFRSRNANGPRASIWLDSARKGDPQSKFSYMVRPCFSLSHSRRLHRVRVTSLQGASEGHERQIELAKDTTFWQYMDTLQKEMQSLTSQSPSQRGGNRFRGGFIGYWGYEMKSESLDLQPDETISRAGSQSKDDEALPEAQFLFCNSVLELDHVNDQCTIFTLQDATAGSDFDAGVDRPWLGQLRESLQSMGTDVILPQEAAATWLAHVSTQMSEIASPSTSPLPASTYRMPHLQPLDSPEDYKSKVEAARALIAQGESYELCLTTQFTGQLDKSGYKDHFELYRYLRIKNPAPYAAYIEIPQGNTGLGRAILSSSPERFLSKTSSGQVEMKPIKGTLPRAGYGPGEASMAEDTAWAVEEDAIRRANLCADPKERAENLMIVDLIRADLLSFCYPSTVKVPLLMKVESYASVHQLVTTVIGQSKPLTGSIESVQRCFPPGSMTGAPKRRSVTLLERLEGKTLQKTKEWELSHRPRGIYSGCLGWISLDGAMDFSVVIRTAVVDCHGQITVGAGGAITYASHAEKEWQEVVHKVRALGAYKE